MRAQIIHHCTRLRAVPFQRILIQRLTNHQFDRSADAFLEFLDEKCRTEGRIQVAGDLEKARIVTFEEDWHHGRIRFRDHLGREGAPSRIHREAEGAIRGRHGAAGKDADGAPVRQVSERSLARFDIGLHRVPGFVKADRQDNAVDILGFSEHAMRHDPEIATPHL